MTIESVEHREDSSIFSIHEPTRFGEADVHREVTVSHKPEEIAKLPTITPQQIKDLTHDYIRGDVSELDSYQTLPNGVKLVFIRDLDTDWASNTYRSVAHTVRGPYRLVENEPEIQDEFKVKPGDLYISYGKIHILAQVGNGFDPADIECEEYRALCGRESQSWSMPSQGIKGASFIKSLEEGLKIGAKKCLDCLGLDLEENKQ